MIKSDRRAILAIILFAVAFWAGMLAERHLFSPPVKPVTLDEAAMDTLTPHHAEGALTSPRSEGTLTYYHQPAQPVETFPFDPNTADSTTLLRLGLSPWQVRSIYRYRAKGGRWHRPEDFKRTPGMTPELWNRLSPMIRIGEAFRYYSDLTPKAPYSPPAGDSSRPSSSTSPPPGDQRGPTLNPNPSYPRQEKFTELVQLDLNTVDTTTLKKVPGIASYRARQLVTYRDRLGGFISVDQLTEIEGFPEELAVWFVVQTPARRLNLNTATFAQLTRHPYIGPQRARAITNYRRTQGTIHDLAELRLLDGFSEDEISRMTPYIAY